VLDVDHPAGISIDADSTLDLTDNALIVDYGPSTGNPAVGVEDLIGRGYNEGDWLGTGITSSSAAEDTEAVALATGDNNPESEFALVVAFGTAQGGELFAGQDVDATSVVVKFTRRLDFDLDGAVTYGDLSVFNANYGAATTWSHGDLNYDGASNFDDLSVFNTLYEPTPPPAAPAFVDAGASGSQITVTWDAVADATSYDIYRIAGAGPIPANAPPYRTDLLGTQFIDAGLPANGMYTYAVKAASAAGDGALSDVATAASAPAPPTNVLATAVSDSQVNVDWDDAGSGVTYDVYRGTFASFTLDDSSLIAVGLSDNVYADTSVVGSTDYFYAVVAVGAYGTTSSAASPAAGAVTTLAPAPSAPTGLSALAGVGTISLTWTAVTGAASYNVYRAPGETPFGTTPDGNVTTTTYADGSLPPGTTYRYAVSAVNAQGTEARAAAQPPPPRRRRRAARRVCRRRRSPATASSCSGRTARTRTATAWSERRSRRMRARLTSGCRWGKLAPAARRSGMGA